MRNLNHPNDYRAAVESKKLNLDSNCIVCGSGRDDFEFAGVPFEVHVTREHNIFMYLDLVVKLVDKPHDQYTGTETYIADCLYAGNWDFIPFHKTLAVELENERRQQQRDLAQLKMSTLRKQAVAVGVPAQDVAAAVP